MDNDKYLSARGNTFICYIAKVFSSGSYPPALFFVPRAMSTTNKPGAPSDSSIYVFGFYDVGNNEMKAEDPTLPTFQITTTRGMTDTIKLTTLVLTASGGDKPSTIQGELDWKAKKITVGSVSKTFKEAKHKIGGTFSL